MMLIWAECLVSAAHQFNGHPMHGHTYRVRVSVRENGVFLDAEGLYAELQEIRRDVDHRCLNDILAFPSMENLARWFAERFAGRHEVAEVSIERAEGVGCRFIPEAAGS